jgi:hypothetical protein
MNSFIVAIIISLVLLLKNKAIFHEHAARESAGGKRKHRTLAGEIENGLDATLRTVDGDAAERGCRYVLT